MAEQLTMLGLWERTPDRAPAQEELVLTLPPAPLPVDPRQVDLFELASKRGAAGVAFQALVQACVILIRLAMSGNSVFLG